jgi:hypothetical protein
VAAGAVSNASFTFNGTKYVASWQLATFEDAAAACRSHPLLGGAPGTLVYIEHLIQLLTAYGDDQSLQAINAQIVNALPDQLWAVWAWDNSRPCNVLIASFTNLPADVYGIGAHARRQSGPPLLVV